MAEALTEACPGTSGCSRRRTVPAMSLLPRACVQDVQDASMEGVYCYSELEVGELANEITGLQDKAEAHRAALERWVSGCMWVG